MKPIEDFFKQHPKLEKTQATTYFRNYQEIIRDRQDIILSVMQDVVNYELWVASGVGCSICNPYYHEKFDSMGKDGIYFDDLAYCSNFFRNSGNYLSAFRNMRFLQHNLNVLLNFLKVDSSDNGFGSVMDKKNFLQWARQQGMMINPNLNPQNLWKYGLKFGIEYSSDKFLSQKAKVNNCIEEVNNKNYSAECQEICLETNPVNEVTMAQPKFVMNLLLGEYIIDVFWERSFPGYFSDTITKEFPNENSSDIQFNKEEQSKVKDETKSDKKPTINKRRGMLKRKGAIEIADNVDINDKNFKLKTLNDFNMVKYYFEEMLRLSFSSVFLSKLKLLIKEGKNNIGNYIDFEDLDTTVVSFKGSWLPFVDSMKYQNVRVTYDDHALRASVGLVLVLALLFKVFN